MRAADDRTRRIRHDLSRTHFVLHADGPSPPGDEERPHARGCRRNAPAWRVTPVACRLRKTGPERRRHAREGTGPSAAHERTRPRAREKDATSEERIENGAAATQEGWRNDRRVWGCREGRDVAERMRNR